MNAIVIQKAITTSKNKISSNKRESDCDKLNKNLEFSENSVVCEGDKCDTRKKLNFEHADKDGEFVLSPNTFSSKVGVDDISIFTKSSLKRTATTMKISEGITNNQFIEICNSSDMDDLKEDSEVLLCGVCRKRFSNKASMTIHFLSHFEECPSCEKCMKTFTVPKDYAEHCMKHVLYTCFVCEQTFFQIEQFGEHKLVHNLVCFRCKKKFPSESDLQDHYSVHEGIINMQCKVCQKYYKTKNSLQRHIHSQHSLNAKCYSCDLCTSKFTSSGTLNKHIQVFHQNIKPFVCHLCGKGYTMKGSLTTHLLHHKGEKPYTCLICGRSFADVRQFKRHGMEHVNVDTDPCEICGKVFENATKLKIHFKAHLNKGNYQCDVCSHAFNYGSHLKRHKMIHENVRPFYCEVCGKCFIERVELRRHLRKKHHFDEERIIKAIDALNKVKKEKYQTLSNEDDSTKV